MEEHKPEEVVAIVSPVVATEPARKTTRKRKTPAPVPIAPVSELADDDASDSDTRPVITTGRHKKKARNTTVVPKKSEPSEWVTGVIRTTALIALGGASFYFQNIYGKKTEEVKKPMAPVAVQPLPQPAPSTNYFTPPKKANIGSSGFNQ